MNKTKIISIFVMLLISLSPVYSLCTGDRGRVNGIAVEYRHGQGWVDLSSGRIITTNQNDVEGIIPGALTLASLPPLTADSSTQALETSLQQGVNPAVAPPLQPQIEISPLEGGGFLATYNGAEYTRCTINNVQTWCDASNNPPERSIRVALDNALNPPPTQPVGVGPAGPIEVPGIPTPLDLGEPTFVEVGGRTYHKVGDSGGRPIWEDDQGNIITDADTLQTLEAISQGRATATSLTEQDVIDADQRRQRAATEQERAAADAERMVAEQNLIAQRDLIITVGSGQLSTTNKDLIAAVSAFAPEFIQENGNVDIEGLTAAARAARAATATAPISAPNIEQIVGSYLTQQAASRQRFVIGTDVYVLDANNNFRLVNEKTGRPGDAATGDTASRLSILNTQRVTGQQANEIDYTVDGRTIKLTLDESGNYYVDETTGATYRCNGDCNNPESITPRTGGYKTWGSWFPTANPNYWAGVLQGKYGAIASLFYEEGDFQEFIENRNTAFERAIFGGPTQIGAELCRFNAFRSTLTGSNVHSDSSVAAFGGGSTTEQGERTTVTGPSGTTYYFKLSWRVNPGRCEEVHNIYLKGPGEKALYSKDWESQKWGSDTRIGNNMVFKEETVPYSQICVRFKNQNPDGCMSRRSEVCNNIVDSGAAQNIYLEEERLAEERRQQDAEEEAEGGGTTPPPSEPPPTIT